MVITANARSRTTILNAGISTNLQFGSTTHPAIPRARALRTDGFSRWRKHVVVHRDHHRNEHDGVVEQMELDPRHPVLDKARRHRTTKEVMSSDRLNLQQQMFEMMEELN